MVSFTWTQTELCWSHGHIGLHALCIKDPRKPFIKDIILQGCVFFMGGWVYGWGVKTVVQKEESSVCLSGNSYRRQPQQACVGGGGSFVWAPPQSVRCPIVKTLGVNCNREVPSLNLSETTFGNALALHTSMQLALSCSPNSALLPVFHLFRLLAAHFHRLVRRRKSRGTEFAREEATGRFQGLRFFFLFFFFL